ncbi:MAG TPA: deoxyribonuclease IV [Actinomycetota bacterium]|nr:deoxyribonuclease IV [Actinomycetota bacterium]
MIIGAHVPGVLPLQEAEEVGADCIQMFVGNPQSFRKPPPREDADELISANVPMYVHAPYLINVASPNNRIRIPSRKLLQQSLDCAHAIGASGLIVHGGHAEDDVKEGFVRWRKALEQIESDVPVLIENTAGGTNAVARYVHDLARLWDCVGTLNPGFCFDTCHAHAAGEDLSDVVERALAAVGKIDVVHCNNSRDAAGSGADRHANFASGKIDNATLLHMVNASRSQVLICETPWERIGDDIDLLRTATS